MLQRLTLDAAQIAELHDALVNEGDGRLLTENSVNLTALVGFLGTRFLPLPPIDAHNRVLGEERDWDVALMQGEAGFVLLQQLRREGEDLHEGAGSVSAYLLLRSQLSFAPESREDDWPLRVRALLLEVVEWTLVQAPQAPDSPLWRALRDPAGAPRMLEPDTDKLRQVLAGTTTVQALWSPWAQDEATATAEFEQCLGMRSMIANLVFRAPRSAR